MKQRKRKKERKMKYRKRERKQTNWQAITQTKEREKNEMKQNYLRQPWKKWIDFIQNQDEFENVSQIPSRNLRSFLEHFYLNSSIF